MIAKKKAEPKSDIYIAAIGASAGGLEALQKLISHIPADIKNVAFVVVQHLSPTYKSMLVQTLSSQTKLEVIEVKDSVVVRERHIYITPPDCEITIKKGKLYLNKTTQNYSPHPSINVLLDSLAADRNRKAIGVILSGTGTDGADGIRAIKTAGGITMAQNPKSAKYNSMPLAAIDTGKVDFVLTPEKIAEQIALLASNDKRKLVRFSAEEIRNRGYDEIIELLSKETGTDFTNYKHNTIYRRIDKRMAELKLDSVAKYLKYIEKNQTEPEELFNNVLIGVTSFFREPAVFKLLEKQLSTLIDSKADNAPVRVWLPGCSTGEEVYSVAIIIAGLLKKKNRQLPVQIFGTDINEGALITARKAVYTTKSIQQVPADKAKEYFIRHNSHVEVTKFIRGMVLFSRHDLTHNPPFLKLDLIVCRNLLIYFNSKLQDYVFPVFFSALNPHGYLLLGKSEGIGHFTDLFTPLHRDAKIYQRKGGASFHSIRYTAIKPSETFKRKPPYEFSVTEMVKETLYKVFEHPYVVVNDNADIKEISGDVSRYLGLKQGQMNANLFKMAHDDLKIELRSLLNRCLKENKEAISGVRKLATAGKEYLVKIAVRPLLYSESPNEFYLVVFEEVKSETIGKTKPVAKAGNGNNARVKELELELNATKEDVQNFVERLESANAEFQTVNEELQSSNEELKISNEELETANEELQSTNEEINIAYAELKAANITLEKQEILLRKSEVNILALLNNNLQMSVLIDSDYKIIAFNELAVKTFKAVSNVQLAEGENFEKLISRKEFAAFIVDFKNALKGKAVTAERTIKDKLKNEKTYAFNFTPVSNGDKKIDCISFSMVEITEFRKTKLELDRSEAEIERLSYVASHSNNAVIIANNHGCIEWVNNSFSKLTGYTFDEVKGKKPGDILQGKETDEETVKRISERLKKHLPSPSEVILNYTKSGDPIWISSDITPIFKDGKLINFISFMTDLTDLIAAKELKKEQEVLLQRQQLFNAIAKYFPNGVIGIINQDLNYVFVGGTELKKLGLTHHEMIGEKVFDKVHPKSNEFAEPFLRRTFKGEKVSFELSIAGNSYLLIAVPVKYQKEPITQSLVVIQNITEIKKTQEELLNALQKQKELNDLKSKFVSIASHEFRTPLSTILSSSFLVGKYNKTEDSEKREKHLERIKTSVNNLTDILNDFLSVGKIEEGGLKNRPTLFNVNSFFKDLMEEMKPYLKTGQQIIFNHKGSEMASLDRQHLKNIFINLLSNAIKYSPEEKPIHLTSTYGKDSLEISVRDEGIGIPEEDQKHLFETFFRANNVSNIQGTGMGLHIVKKYLQIMGASIQFTSAENKGTTFNTRFPQAKITQSNGS